jgi:hypothetical protein
MLKLLMSWERILVGPIRRISLTLTLVVITVRARRRSFFEFPPPNVCCAGDWTSDRVIAC